MKENIAKISKAELKKIDNCLEYFYSCYKNLTFHGKIVLFKRFMSRFKKDLQFKVKENE